MNLKLDWATFEATKYACQNWHYSKCVPAGKLVKIGVWEDGKFIGVVIFSRGANNQIGTPYGLKQTEVCELTRVALNKHVTPVTRIVAIAIRMLRKFCPGLRLIVSYADPEQGHKGGIYQGGGWLYTGRTNSAEEYIVNGKRMHGRSMRAKYGTHTDKPWIKVVQGSSKHRYCMPLDDVMKLMIESQRLPYPKCAESIVSDVSRNTILRKAAQIRPPRSTTDETKS